MVALALRAQCAPISSKGHINVSGSYRECHDQHLLGAVQLHCNQINLNILENNVSSLQMLLCSLLLVIRDTFLQYFASSEKEATHCGVSENKVNSCFAHLMSEILFSSSTATPSDIIMKAKLLHSSPMFKNYNLEYSKGSTYGIRAIIRVYVARLYI